MKEITLTVDEVFDLVGHFGRAQALYSLIITSMSIFTGLHMVLNIFAGYSPHFTCLPVNSVYDSGEHLRLLPVAVLSHTEDYPAHFTPVHHVDTARVQRLNKENVKPFLVDPEKKPVVAGVNGDFNLQGSKKDVKLGHNKTKREIPAESKVVSNRFLSLLIPRNYHQSDFSDKHSYPNNESSHVSSRASLTARVKIADNFLNASLNNSHIYEGKTLKNETNLEKKEIVDSSDLVAFNHSDRIKFRTKRAFLLNDSFHIDNNLKTFVPDLSSLSTSSSIESTVSNKSFVVTSRFSPAKKNSSVLSDACPNNDPTSCQLTFLDDFKSIVTEWGLVCGRRHQVASVQAAWMTGVMCGALFLGGLPDSYGRWSASMVSMIITVVFEGLTSFTRDFKVYIVLRLLGGISCSIIILSNFVLSQEVVGPRWRSSVGAMSSIIFSVGIGLLALLAYATQNWRTLSLMVSAIGLPLALLMLFVPESPRWLLSKGRSKEAKAVFLKIARFGGKTSSLPSEWSLVLCPSRNECASDVSDDSDEDGVDTRPFVNSSVSSRTKISDRVQKKIRNKSAGIREMLRHGYIIGLLLIQLYCWFVNAAVYYGLTLAADVLGSNIYISTTLSGFVEIPSNIICVSLMERLGRRSCMIGFMVISGLSCLVLPLLPPLHVTYTTLALLSKFCISASYSVAYVLSGEIFPTSVRNTGMGMVSVSARLGGVVCPYMLMLGDIKPGLQFALLGLLALSSAVLNSTLPETLGRPTPETIDDLLAFRSIQTKKNDCAYNKVESSGAQNITILTDSDGEESIELYSVGDERPLLD